MASFLIVLLDFFGPVQQRMQEERDLPARLLGWMAPKNNPIIIENMACIEARI